MTAGRIAFGLLAVGFLIQLITIVWGGAVYPGYDPSHQYISELGATGAVIGHAVSWWGFAPSGVLIGAGCGLGAWLSRRSRLAVAAWLLLGWYGLTLAAAGVYPCEFECARADASFNALMHDLYGGTGYLAGIVALPLAALAARKQARPKLALLACVCAVLAVLGFAGVITGTQPGGLIQRVLEGSVDLFTLVFGWTLIGRRPVAAAVIPA
jgi:hypothetical membrane protein